MEFQASSCLMWNCARQALGDTEDSEKEVEQGTVCGLEAGRSELESQLCFRLIT